jgi:hypothetical protein
MSFNSECTFLTKWRTAVFLKRPTYSDTNIVFKLLILRPIRTWTIVKSHDSLKVVMVRCLTLIVPVRQTGPPPATELPPLWFLWDKLVPILLPNCHHRGSHILYVSEACNEIFLLKTKQFSNHGTFVIRYCIAWRRIFNYHKLRVRKEIKHMQKNRENYDYNQYRYLSNMTKKPY